MNDLGKKIKFLRNNKGWSLDELSKRCNVPKTTIWGIERGSQTSLENLKRITEALDISIDTLKSEENFDAEIMKRAIQLATDKMIFYKSVKTILNPKEDTYLNSQLKKDILTDLGNYVDHDTLLRFRNKSIANLPNNCVLDLLDYIHDTYPNGFLKLYKDLIATNIYDLDGEIKNHCNKLYLDIAFNSEFRDLVDKGTIEDLVKENPPKKMHDWNPERHILELLKDTSFPTYKLDNTTLEILYEKTMNFLGNELIELEKTNYRYPGDNENNKNK